MRRLGWLGVLLLYAALAVGGWGGALLAAGGLAAVGRAVYAPGDGFTLLGPLARWELTRTGRRRALFLWRAVAAGAVAVAAGSVFDDFTGWWSGQPGYRFRNQPIGYANYAAAAEQVIVPVAIGVFYLAFFFSLFHLPGVIPEEREANRLEHLLVTDLRSHEILLGKTAGRLAVLLSYTAAGLPVLVAVSFYGGVTVESVLAGGLVLLGGLAAFAAVAVWVGAGMQRSAGAVGATFGTALLFGYGLAGLVALADWGAVPGGKLGPLARDIARTAAAVLSAPVPGNPVRLVQEVRAASGSGTLDAEAGRLLRGYFACVLVVVALFGGLAARRLRRVGAKPTAVSKPGVRGWFAGPPYRPPVTDRPVEWHTRWTPGSAPERWLGRLVRGRWWAVGAAAGLLIAVWVAGGGGRTVERLRAIIPAAGPVLLFAVTLPVGVNAARSVARERARDTLEGLLLTGLEPAEIVRQNWWATVRTVDGQLAAAAVAMGISLLAGGSFLGFLAVVVSTAVNMALAASLGLYCSVRAKSPGRAVGGLVGGSAVWACGWGLFAGLIARGGTAELVFVGAAVPAVHQCLGGFAGLVGGGDAGELVVMYLLGLVSAAASARAVYCGAASEFERRVRPAREVPA